MRDWSAAIRSRRPGRSKIAPEEVEPLLEIAELTAGFADVGHPGKIATQEGLRESPRSAADPDAPALSLRSSRRRSAMKIEPVNVFA